MRYYNTARVVSTSKPRICIFINSQLSVHFISFALYPPLARSTRKSTDKQIDRTNYTVVRSVLINNDACWYWYSFMNKTKPVEISYPNSSIYRLHICLMNLVDPRSFRPVERKGVGRVSYPGPATFGGPPSLKYKKYTRMSHFKRKHL